LGRKQDTQSNARSVPVGTIPYEINSELKSDCPDFVEAHAFPALL
jgi:hypothetical protein